MKIKDFVLSNFEQIRKESGFCPAFFDKGFKSEFIEELEKTNSPNHILSQIEKAFRNICAKEFLLEEEKNED